MTSGPWRLTAALLRRLRYASRYRNRGAWLTSYYDALVRAVPAATWPGSGTVFEINLRELRAPLYVRLGTTDWFVAEEIFLRHVYAPVRTAVLSAPTNIVDLGANIGLTAVLWNAWWPEANVLAVEPDAGNLEMLARNTAPFARHAHVIRGCAVGVARDVALDREHGAAAYRIAHTTASEWPRLPGFTVTQLLSDHGIAKVDLLKCDIEGAEREVFAHCEAWIRRVRCMIVEVHDGFETRELLGMVKACGGEFVAIDSGDPTLALLRNTA